MKKIIFSFFLILMIQSNICAQGEGNIWYFNNALGVNFNQTCDIADLSNAMNGAEGTVSLSDENGNLLFYSNGGSSTQNPSWTGAIWNRNHEIMYDMGTNEGGGVSARQPCVAIPKPSEPNHYYLFTMDEIEADNAGTFRGFSYFEIDMDLNSGLGGVIDYQPSISTFSFNESMAAVLRPDGNSYWVVISGPSGLDYYLVDDNGVNLDHVQQLIPNSSFGPYTISPNGEYISLGGNVADFDTEAGLYSNPVTFLATGLGPVGSAFSPNSRYFYATQLFDNKVFRVDMEAADIQASIEELPTNLSDTETCGHMLAAPDGHMYFIHTDGTNSPDQLSFSAILCPNSETPCVKENIYTFDGNNNGVAPGLPSFTDHYFMSDIVENGLPVCTDQSATEICEGEEVTLSVKHYLADTFEWSTGESTDSISVSSPGIYTVTVSDGCCNTTEETFEILSIASGILELQIEGENVLCDGESSTLTANSNFAISYEWSTGSTESSILVSDAGTYMVSVTDVCNNVITREVEVVEENSNTIEVIIEGDINCGGSIIASVETTTSTIQWSTGETSTEITIEEAGNYFVQLENTCGNTSEEFTVAPSEKIYDIPNAFTPDQDGINDVFRPIWGCNNISAFDFKIFNRWGLMVYQSTDPNGVWDGALNGRSANSDVYIYTLSFNLSENNRIETAGDVTLIR